MNNDDRRIVLVCGGREYNDRERVFRVLDALNRDVGIRLLVHGGARGADCIAGEWAMARGIDRTIYPANWNGHRTAAGPIRNARMLRDAEPDIVVAFPGGKGTANMIALARQAGVKVEEPDSDNGTTSSNASAPAGDLDARIQRDPRH